MNKNEKLFSISKILVIIGFLLILGNGWIGNVLANIWLNMVGGMADTNIYEYHMYSFSTSFLTLGAILFGVGLIVLLFSWYQKSEN